MDVYFPSQGALDDEPRGTVDPDALRGAGTIMIVDDEPMIVALLRTVLESYGYQALSAHSGGEALSLFERHCPSVAAVVLDRTLPTVDGREVFDTLRQAAAGLPIVLVSGTVPAADEKPIPAGENTRFVAKPFSPTEILEALKSLRDE